MLNEKVTATSALFVLAYLGHQTGDFILQNMWMALNKSQKNIKGYIACTAHVSLYTLSVVTALWIGGGNITPLLAGAIFIPHWIIDHWSLGEEWLKITGSRTREKVEASTGLVREYGFAFYAPVYINVDNTMHFLCLWATIWWLVV